MIHRALAVAEARIALDGASDKLFRSGDSIDELVTDGEACGDGGGECAAGPVRVPGVDAL